MSGKAKTPLAKAQSRKENKRLSLCGSLRLCAFARDSSFLHAFFGERGGPPRRVGERQSRLWRYNSNRRPVQHNANLKSKGSEGLLLKVGGTFLVFYLAYRTSIASEGSHSRFEPHTLRSRCALPLLDYEDACQIKDPASDACRVRWK